MGKAGKIGAALAGLGLTMASGCAQIASSEVSQSAIYASYSASYDDSTNQLTFSATFSVGGSTGTSVLLDGGSSVSIDGIPLPESTDLVGEYVYSLTETATSGDLAGIHTFLYVDNTGKSYANTVQIPPDVSVDTVANTTISASAHFVVNWASPVALTSEDAVEVTLQKSDYSTSVVATDYGTGDTSGQVVFSPANLSPLGQGNFRELVCLQGFTPAPSVSEAGGNISVTRCLAEIPIVVGP